MACLKILLATASLLALCGTAQAQSVDLVLKASGGETIRTFPGLQAAVDVAVGARRADPAVTIEFILHGGPHRLARPVVVDATLSGVPAAPTVIRARNDERPELRAAQVLALDWREGDDGIWFADVDLPEVEQLWIAGQRQTLARYPNRDPSVVPLEGYSADALSPERAARWSHPEDGVVRAIHFSRWGGVLYRILGRAPDGSVRLSPAIGNNRVQPPQDAPHERYRYVEGLREELDATGEWFFDRRAKRLFLKPAADVDLARAEVEVTTGPSILRLVGDRGVPVHDVMIEGLSFSRARDTLLDADEPLLRSDWVIAREGAVFVEGAERVTLQNMDFHGLGGQAVFVSGYNRNVRVAGSAFWDIGGTAISFVGRSSAVRSPAFEYLQSVPLDQIDRTPGPLTPDYPADSSAEDNLIHDVGRSDKQAPGVEISMAARIHVSHNSIYDTPRAGINIGDGTWGGHVLEHNDVFNTVLETGDHGAFNSWGRDRFWMADRAAMDAAVAADPTLPFLDAVEPVVIRNNRFQSDHGWDVDLDDGSSNYEIYDNVMLTGGLKLREGFRRRVWNNVLVNNSLHPHVWFKASGDTFERNIVMAPYQPILMEHWSGPIDHNLFPNDAALEDARAFGGDASSDSGDPDFIDAAAGEYLVQSSSPAAGIGFRNFEMDFGVRSPRLRAMTRQPEIPKLIRDSGAKAGARVQAFGAEMKNVETLGEQSAAGLPDVSGVLVLAVSENSAAATAGLRRGDVIVKMLNSYGGTVLGPDLPIATTEDLLSIVQARKWQGAIRFEIQRNQQRQDIEVTP